MLARAEFDFNTNWQGYVAAGGSEAEGQGLLFGEQARYPGVVAWCRKQPDDYLVGIAFIDEDTLFRARMVEQVCQIEHYRHQRELELGQALPIEAAASTKSILAY